MGKKIDQLDVYDDVNTDKSRRDLFEVSKNTGTYASPTYATDGSRKISVEQLKETLFIKEINSYKSVTTGSPTFDKQAYNGIGNSGTYTLPTSTGKYEVLAIIIEGSLSVTVTGLGGGYGDLVFTNQNETAYLIDTTYGWYPLAVNKEVNSSAFELLANKENTTLDTSTTKYPTNNLVKTYVDNLGNTLTSGLDTKLTKANNLSDLTNTSQARDNILLGATNDVTHNSITLSNTTVSTLPFIDSAKKLISATGALFGTWFQTLTADTNPVDADTIVVNDSTASFEAKKTTLTQLWTNYIKPLFLGGGTLTGALNEAPSITLASATTTDIGNANSNNIIISGTTTITSFGTVAEGVVRVIRFSGALILTHNATSLILPNGTSITTQNGDTAIFRSLGSGNWICISYKSVTALSNNYISNFDGTKYVNSPIAKNSTLGVIFDCLDTSGYLTSLKFKNTSGTTITSRIEVQTVNNWLTLNGGFVILQATGASFQVRGDGYNRHDASYHEFLQSGTRNARLDNSGLSLGTGSINASAQLDLQATNKGFLPNRMTNAQRTAISSPAIGLMVYCTDATEGLYIYKSTGWTFII